MKMMPLPKRITGILLVVGLALAGIERAGADSACEGILCGNGAANRHAARTGFLVGLAQWGHDLARAVTDRIYNSTFLGEDWFWGGMAESYNRGVNEKFGDLVGEHNYIGPEDISGLRVVGAEIFNNVAMEAATVGIVAVAPLTQRGLRSFLGRDIPKHVRQALKMMSSPAGYAESLRAYRHFHVQGLESATYTGPMEKVYRTQFIQTERLSSHATQKGGIDFASAMIKNMGSPGSDITNWYRDAHRVDYFDLPYVSTAGDVPDFALHHLGGGTGLSDGLRLLGKPGFGNDVLWQQNRLAGYLYEIDVPTALTLGRVDWRSEFVGAGFFRHYNSYSEVPVFHEITPGMVRSVTPVKPASYILPSK